ncbi:MAG TPA: serine hydrolase [Thermomicrobiales bacterium]|nr:serine hydrolase [Thermomicrobiales bacterium]
MDRRQRWSARAALTLALAAAMLLGIFGEGIDGAAAPVPRPSHTVPVTPPATPGARPAASPTAEVTPGAGTPAATPVMSGTATEQHLAQNLVAGEAGVYGFVVLAADGTIIASRNSTAPFVMASLYKLILMADLYQRIEARTLDPDQEVVIEGDYFDEDGDMYFDWAEVGSTASVRDCLYAMGAFSSNVAARALLAFTDAEALRETAVAIGMEDTYLLVTLDQLPAWPPVPGADASAIDVALSRDFIEANERDGNNGPLNITTPMDMAHYDLALLNRTLISPWVSDQITAVLRDQMVRDRIPFLLPPDVPVINKTGNLEGVVNDVGIEYLPDGPRVVALLAQAVPDDERATQILQRLALIASGEVTIPPLPEPTEARDEATPSEMPSEETTPGDVPYDDPDAIPYDAEGDYSANQIVLPTNSELHTREISRLRSR